MQIETIETILAAISDPSERTQPVLERAARLAESASAELVVFHAAFDSALSGRPLFDSRRRARSRGLFVEKRIREIQRHNRGLQKRGLNVRTHVVWEEPAYEAIIRASIREKADLIVAGPHAGGRAMVPFSFRQNDWQLLRLCPRPLLLVRSPRDTNGAVIAALDPTHANDKPATLDRALARTAASLAAAMDAELHAVHSIPPAAYPLDERSARARIEMREKLRKKIERSLKRSNVLARTHVLQGPPEKTIPELAKKLDAQLLVMGAISRRGLKRFAIGDTAERIIDALPCDLLVLKPENFKLTLGRARRESVIATSV